MVWHEAVCVDLEKMSSTTLLQDVDQQNYKLWIRKSLRTATGANRKEVGPRSKIGNAF